MFVLCWLIFVGAFANSSAFTVVQLPEYDYGHHVNYDYYPPPVQHEYYYQAPPPPLFTKTEAQPLFALYYLIQTLEMHRHPLPYHNMLDTVVEELLDEGLQYHLYNLLYNVDGFSEIIMLSRYPQGRYHGIYSLDKSFVNDYRQLIPVIHGTLAAINTEDNRLDYETRKRLIELKKHTSQMTFNTMQYEEQLLRDIVEGPETTEKPWSLNDVLEYIFGKQEGDTLAELKENYEIIEENANDPVDDGKVEQFIVIIEDEDNSEDIDVRLQPTPNDKIPALAKTDDDDSLDPIKVVEKKAESNKDIVSHQLPGISTTESVTKLIEQGVPESYLPNNENTVKNNTAEVSTELPLNIDDSKTSTSTKKSDNYFETTYGQSLPKPTDALLWSEIPNMTLDNHLEENSIGVTNKEPQELFGSLNAAHSTQEPSHEGNKNEFIPLGKSEDLDIVGGLDIKSDLNIDIDFTNTNVSENNFEPIGKSVDLDIRDDPNTIPNAAAGIDLTNTNVPVEDAKPNLETESPEIEELNLIEQEEEKDEPMLQEGSSSISPRPIDEELAKEEDNLEDTADNQVEEILTTTESTEITSDPNEEEIINFSENSINSDEHEQSSTESNEVQAVEDMLEHNVVEESGAIESATDSHSTQSVPLWLTENTTEAEETQQTVEVADSTSEDGSKSRQETSSYRDSIQLLADEFAKLLNQLEESDGFQGLRTQISDKDLLKLASSYSEDDLKEMAADPKISRDLIIPSLQKLIRQKNIEDADAIIAALEPWRHEINEAEPVDDYFERTYGNASGRELDIPIEQLEDATEEIAEMMAEQNTDENASEDETTRSVDEKITENAAEQKETIEVISVEEVSIEADPEIIAEEAVTEAITEAESAADFTVEESQDSDTEISADHVAQEDESLNDISNEDAEKASDEPSSDDVPLLDDQDQPTEELPMNSNDTDSSDPAANAVDESIPDKTDSFPDEFDDEAKSLEMDRTDATESPVEEALDPDA